MDKSKSKRGIVGIDYLQFNIKTDYLRWYRTEQELKLDSPDFLLIKQKHSGKVFNSRFIVYYQGYEIADLLTHPKEPAINPENLVSIRIHNYLLYDKTLWSTIDILAKAMHGTINNISRLDIFCDSTEKLGYCNLLESNLLKLKGNTTKRAIKNSKNQVLTQYLGSRSSDKYTKIYNKTLELKKSNKRYIENIWKDSRVDFEQKDVHRIELTLKSQVFLKYPNFKFTDLKNKILLIKLFLAEVKSTINIYKPRKGVRVDKCKTIDILPQNITAAKALHNTKKTAPKITWRKKLHIKSCIEEYAKDKESKLNFNMALDLAIEYDLEDFLYEKLDKWLEYYEKLYKVKKPEKPKKPPTTKAPTQFKTDINNILNSEYLKPNSFNYLAHL